MHLSRLVSSSRFASERAYRSYARDRFSLTSTYVVLLCFFSSLVRFVSFRFDSFSGCCWFGSIGGPGSRVYVYILARPASRTRALTRTRSHTTLAAVLYNAAIDSRPLLSFTHAICCSRCNPCPVTASSVQSPLPGECPQDLFSHAIYGVARRKLRPVVSSIAIPWKTARKIKVSRRPLSSQLESAAAYVPRSFRYLAVFPPVRNASAWYCERVRVCRVGVAEEDAQKWTRRPFAGWAAFAKRIGIVSMDLIGYVDARSNRCPSVLRRVCRKRSVETSSIATGEGTESRPGYLSSAINCDRVTFYRYFLDLDLDPRHGLLSSRPDSPGTERCAAVLNEQIAFSRDASRDQFTSASRSYQPCRSWSPIPLRSYSTLPSRRVSAEDISAHLVDPQPNVSTLNVPTRND